MEPGAGGATPDPQPTGGNAAEEAAERREMRSRWAKRRTESIRLHLSKLREKLADQKKALKESKSYPLPQIDVDPTIVEVPLTSEVPQDPEELALPPSGNYRNVPPIPPTGSYTAVPPGAPGTVPSTGSYTAVPPGAPGTVPSTGSYGAVPSTGSYGAVPPTGPYGAVPSPGPSGAVPGSGTHGVLPGSGTHGALPRAGTHGVLPGSGTHGALPGSGTHGVLPGSGAHGALPPRGGGYSSLPPTGGYAAVPAVPPPASGYAAYSDLPPTAGYTAVPEVPPEGRALDQLAQRARRREARRSRGFVEVPDLERPQRRTKSRPVVHLPNPVLAGILSAFLPGVGQVYCRRYARGVTWMFLLGSATAFASFSDMAYTDYPGLASVAIMLWVGVVTDAVLLAQSIR